MQELFSLQIYRLNVKKLMIMRYITTIFLSLFSLLSVAQNNSETKGILDKAAAKFKAYPAAEVNFTLEMDNPAEDIHEIHEGKAFMKGNLYKLNLMDVENYYDGKYIYTYMPEVQEVNIKNPNDEEEELLNPTTLFDIHNQGFRQKLVSNTNGIAYIELYPTAEGKNFTKIGIWVKTATSSIQKVTSFGKDGNNVTVTIQSIKQPATIPADSFFQFDKARHPEVEVIDLR